MKNYTLITLCLFGFFKNLSAQKVMLNLVADQQKVEVMIDGKPFTNYIFPSDTVLKKPVLFPIFSPNGTIVTRGYPFAPRAGERIDHPHHVGLWLNYEYVNGFDFWNNSNAIKNPTKYGTIYHTKITKMKSGKKATLSVEADWITANGKGKNVLKEKTTYIFQVKNKVRIIDRITTLTAQADTVFLNDVKDGMIALRLARELEHPSDKADEFLDANGIVTKVDKLNNTHISGKYRSSEGIEGDNVWSTRAKWVNLTGRIGSDNISVCMIDHPQNLRYPTYWHARGYGLFAANPLGGKVFSKGEDVVNLKLAPNQSITFRYRIVVASRHLSDAENEALSIDFAKVK